MKRKVSIIDFVYRGVVIKVEYDSLLFVKIRYFFRVSYFIRLKVTKLLLTMNENDCEFFIQINSHEEQNSKTTLFLKTDDPRIYYSQNQNLKMLPPYIR